MGTYLLFSELHSNSDLASTNMNAIDSFSHPEEALRAATEIQQRFRPGEQDSALRVSIHRGRGLAVRLDSNIDYFGNTVNYAAKIQSVAGAGEVVFFKEFHALPNIAETARKFRLEVREKPFLPSFKSGSNVVLIATLEE